MKKSITSVIFIFTFFLSSNLFPKNALARRDLPDNNLAYPVLIVLKDGSKASGFYLHDPNFCYFVTAKHVLFNIPPQEASIKVDDFSKNKEFPENLKDKIKYDSENKLLIYKGTMLKAELELLIKWAPDHLSKKYFNELFKKTQYYLKSESATLLSYSPNPDK